MEKTNFIKKLLKKIGSIRKDYLLHLVLGDIIFKISNLISFNFTNLNLIISMGVVAIFAIAKEFIWDKYFKNGEFDWMDIIWTIIGGLTAYIYILLRI